MTTRLERATCALRQAEIDLADAMQRCEEASVGVLVEARLMEQPRFRQWPHDERSVAERQRDRDASREDISP